MCAAAPADLISLPCPATTCRSDGDKLIACKSSTGNCPSGYIPASLASNSADEQCWQAAANFTSCAKVSNRTLSLYSQDATTQGAVLTRCIFRAPGTTNCSTVTGFTTSLTDGSSLAGCYNPITGAAATGKCPSSVVPAAWSFALYDRTAAADSTAVLSACLSGVGAIALSQGCGAVLSGGVSAAGYDAEVSAAGVPGNALLGCVKSAACPKEHSKFLLTTNATLDSCQTTLATCPATNPVTMCSGDAQAATAAGQCSTPDGCMAFDRAVTRCNAAATSSIGAYPRFIVETPGLTATLKGCFKTSTACPGSFPRPARGGTDNTAPIFGCTDLDLGTCTLFWQTVAAPLGGSTWVCAA